MSRMYMESEQEKLRKYLEQSKREQIATSNLIQHLSGRLDRLEQKFQVELERWRKHRMLVQTTLQKLNKYLDTWV